MHPTQVLPRQFRELGITEGPSVISNSARKWAFYVQGSPMCLTANADTPQNVPRAVVIELKLIDVLHLYLSAAGMDFNFAFNSAGS